VIEATHVRAAGPKLDAGDMRELTAMLDDISDLMPMPTKAAAHPVT